MHILIYYLYLCAVLHRELAYETDLSNEIDDPDINRNVSELITSKGYPVEEHCVKTADGYLLSVQRIPHGRNRTTVLDEKKAVLLIHGVVADATNWVLNYPGQSLGFLLADEGYDVWLLNTRGCAYSRKHVKYTTSQSVFWDFSFSELAQYDVPNTIDYILSFTEKEAIYIIGHSQGTTAVFAMLSETPDYNDKVKLFIALAPVVFIGHVNPSTKYLIPFITGMALSAHIMNSGEFFSEDGVKKVKGYMCPMNDPEECYNFLSDTLGWHDAKINTTRIPVYHAHYPSSSSAKSLFHFKQMLRSKKFRKFDYGRYRNLKHYNQEEPPEYDLSLITAPVALFSTTRDSVVNIEDVKYLQGKLNSVVSLHCISEPFGHSDYFIALSAPQLIYGPILKLLAEY